MAKRTRYFEYEELLEIPEVLRDGRHFMRTTKHGDRVLVEGSDRNSDPITLFPGDRLAYVRGKIWRVMRPEEYENPIRGVIAELRLPKGLLLYSDDPVVYKLVGEDTDQLGQGARRNMTSSEDREGKEPSGYPQELTGYDAIVVYYSIVARVTRRIKQIVVRNGVDRTKVANWLRETLS